MKLLALESSAKAASCAVLSDGEPLASAWQATGLTHSRTLLPMAADLLKNSGLSLADMDAVAVAAGPGSFTGLRIGISAAKGLAWGAEKPCLGVSTLEAMAWPLCHLEGIVVCAMDARRKQIYNAVFRCEKGLLTRLREDRAISLEDAAADLRDLEGPRPTSGSKARWGSAWPPAASGPRAPSAPRTSGPITSASARPSGSAWPGNRDDGEREAFLFFSLSKEKNQKKFLRKTSFCVEKSKSPGRTPVKKGELEGAEPASNQIKRPVRSTANEAPARGTPCP